MSAADFQIYRGFLDPQLQQQYPNHKRRIKEIGRRWKNLGPRAAKQAEVTRIQGIAGAAVTSQDQQQVPAPQAQTTTQTQTSQIQSQPVQSPADGAARAQNDDEENAADPDDEVDPAANESRHSPIALASDDIPTLVRARSHRRYLLAHVEHENPDFRKTRLKKRKINFLEEDKGLGAGWIGAGSPSTGSMNLVGVWVHIDDDGHVDDRVFVKDSYVASRTWTNLSFWSGDITDPSRREPVESAALKRLEALGYQPNPFIELRNKKTRVSYTRMMYRLYVTYLPYRDAQALLNRFNYLGEPIPEPWLWNVLETLARAALIMEQGDLQEPVQGWKEIVHRDLKPANVFFDEPDDNFYPIYCTPKVGDFGFAFETSPEDPFNPIGYKVEFGACGTRGYIAPENFTWMDNQTGEVVDEYPIHSPCNIWGIGATMYTLITGLQPKIVRSRYRKLDVTNNSTARPEEPDYSDRLLALVSACLEYVPDKRITAADLLAEIWQSTETYDERGHRLAYDHSEGFRLRDTLPTRADRLGYEIMHPENFWTLGMTAEQVRDNRERDVENLRQPSRSRSVESERRS